MKQILGKPARGDIALAIVDMDSFLYKAAYIAQKFKYRVMFPPVEVDGDPVVYSDTDGYLDGKAKVADIVGMGGIAWLDRQEDPKTLGHSLNALKEMITRVQDYLQAYEYHYVITGPDNFRNRVAQYSEYKANRKDKPKPLNYAEVREWAIDKYQPTISQDCEADDVVAQIQWIAYNRLQSGDCGWEDVTCVVSIDKDLRQAPGLNYNPNHRQLEWISEWDAEVFFYQQVLSGDATDGIPGLPGIGEGMAAKILQGCLTVGEMDARVYRRYASYLDKSKHEGWAQDYTPRSLMMEMGQLVRMRRFPGEMWEPLSRVRCEGKSSLRSKITIGGK